jgi:hypothetical protein
MEGVTYGTSSHSPHQLSILSHALFTWSYISYCMMWLEMEGVTYGTSSHSPHQFSILSHAWFTWSYISYCMMWLENQDPLKNKSSYFTYGISFTLSTLPTISCMVHMVLHLLLHGLARESRSS